MTNITIAFDYDISRDHYESTEFNTSMVELNVDHSSDDEMIELSGTPQNLYRVLTEHTWISSSDIEFCYPQIVE